MATANAGYFFALSILGGANKLPAILVNWLGKVTFVACVVTLVLITVLLFPRFSDDVVNHSRSECLSSAQRNLVYDEEFGLIVGKLVADR